MPHHCRTLCLEMFGGVFNYFFWAGGQREDFRGVGCGLVGSLSDNITILHKLPNKALRNPNIFFLNIKCEKN